MNNKSSLSLLDATMIVAGSMIGSGIFIVSADITSKVASAGWLLLIWLLAGFLTIVAAVSYGELSAMYPKAGGQYVYLKEAYGKLWGFLYGWSLFAVIQTGTIAAVAVAFTKFAAYFFSILELNPSNVVVQITSTWSIQYAHFVSILLIILLTYINTKGVEGGKIIQTVFTVTKLVAIFALLLFGLFKAFDATVWQTNWTNAFAFGSIDKSTGQYSSVAFSGMLAGITGAMVGSVFSSDAWNNVTFIAGEVRNPQRNIGLSLFLGTLVVTAIYVLMNIMYTATLTMPQIAMAPSERVGVAVSKVIFGDMGTSIIALLIMVSTFGCINGMILAGSRVYYTMAQDNLFFKQAAVLNKENVPQKSLWIQAAWTSILCLSGKYGDLLDYVVFVVLLFYMLTIYGIIRLRKTQPQLHRPYKAFLYPYLPILYIVLVAILSALLLIYKPMFTVPGLIIVLLGIPVYYFVLNKKEIN